MYQGELVFIGAAEAGVGPAKICHYLPC